MIRLDRGPAPPFFGSKDVEKMRSEARAFFGKPLRGRAQAKFDFQRFAARLYPRVRAFMRERFPPKCAYCETPTDQPDIEAFRPKQRATNFDGKVDDDHYWWLMFEWSNYLPACRFCNTLKGPRFPVTGPRASIEATGDELRKERRLLLEPCEDDPERVLLFLDDGRVTSEVEQGQVTIDVLGLNRDGLIEARRADLKALLGSLRAFSQLLTSSKVVDDLASLTSKASPFCGMRRQFVRAWAAETAREKPKGASLLQHLLEYNTALGDVDLKSGQQRMRSASKGLSERLRKSEAFSVEQKNVSQDFYRRAQFIEKFELRNVRGFEHLVLSPPIGATDFGSWYVLLGENATGKSTILQAIACALVGQKGVRKLGVRASDLLRHGKSEGEVRVYLTGMSKPIVMTLSARGNGITVDPPDPKVMVLAYGATRLIESSLRRPARVSRLNVDNLFDPFVPLGDGKPWLHAANPEQFDRFASSLSSLLPRSDGARLTRSGGEIFVEAPGVRDSLGVMSSGYQAVIALALDIMGVMRLGWQDMNSAEGIVLIDEVDAHLHPRWKMRIVRKLREVFPRVQFIATSHEPLTLRGLERTEIAILNRTLEGSVGAMTSHTHELPSPNALRVDQLLSSEFFGLNSTEDLEVDAKFERYYGLLAMRSRSATQDRELEELRGELEAGRHLGLTPRERLVFAAADEFLAERRTLADSTPAATQTAAREHLKRLWTTMNEQPDADAHTTEAGVT